MADVPTISVTQELDDDLTDDDQDGYDLKDALTDIEDFDSNDEGANIMIKTLRKKIPKTSPNATDIEDYNDSTSEDEKSEAIPDTMFSLTEFLDQGFTEEETKLSTKTTSKTGNKSNANTFLSLFPPEDLGCVTDCENVDTSGDELSFAERKEIETDFTFGNDIVSITDNVRKTQTEQNEKQNCASDVEDDENSSLSEDGDMNYGGEPLSDVENLAMSDAEDDEYHGACGVSLPSSAGTPSSTDVKPGTSQDLNESFDECHTDLEGFVCSDEEDDGFYVQLGEIRILPPDSPNPSLTDTEDVDIGDASDFLPDGDQVSDSSLPAAVRQIVIVKSNKAGDPVASVMPLKGLVSLGIESNFNDKGCTDSEEVSGNEADYYEENPSTTIPEIPEMYNSVAKYNETCKVTNVEKVKTHEVEPITDTEEIVLGGTVRRRKPKSKNQHKGKKFLDVRQEALSVTDVEEIDISDAEQPKKHLLSPKPVASCPGSQSPDIKTDVEYITGEEESSVSDIEEVSPNVNVLVDGHYFSTVTTIESLSERGVQTKRVISPGVRTRFEPQINTQNLTDIEDLQLQSDVEESMLHVSYSRAETVSPSELQEALNDSSVSIVHEKCSNAFNFEAEKNHIKGLKNCTESHTDIEYIEEDIESGKDIKVNEAGEECSTDQSKKGEQKK